MNTERGNGEQIQHIGLILTINACMFVFGIVLLLMGSLLPSLNLTSTRAGSLGSFPLIGILIATVLIGPILDKVGGKPVLLVALLLIASALAVLPSLSSYSTLAAVALAYGLGAGILNTATNALISDLSATGRGAALNLLGFSFSLGAITAPLLMSLARKRFSVSAVLYLLALAPAAVLVLVLALRFPPPAQPGTSLKEMLRVVRQPLVWLFGTLLFFESGNENCMFVWAGAMVRDLLHLEAYRATVALLVVSIALGGGRLLAVLSLKWFGSRVLLLASAFTTIAGAVVALNNHTFGRIVAGFAVIGLGMSAIFPTALGLAGDQFPQETGTVFGVIMTLALAGGAVGPLVGGWAVSSSPVRVLAVPITAGAAVAVLTLVISKLKPRRRSQL
ncbi:MAG: MFS transporter [Candidatus Sulfotelmatobacter sp.]